MSRPVLIQWAVLILFVVLIIWLFAWPRPQITRKFSDDYTGPMLCNPPSGQICTAGPRPRTK